MKQRTDERLVLKGKRTLMRDRLKEIASQMPEMRTRDGKPINHLARLKEIYRYGGNKAVVKYITAVNKIVRRERRRVFLLKILLKLKLSLK